MNQRMAIGKRIRVLLAQQNRSLKELATAAGMSQSNMSMIANGHTMLMPGYASKVARFLGVTIDAL
jgi:transcriptional regulator with XRE-family HTH domain